MARDFIKDLEYKERTLREELESYGDGVTMAKNIADLEKKKTKLEDTIFQYLNKSHEDAGNLKRAGALLSPFTVIPNAIHKTNAEWEKQTEEIRTANRYSMKLLKNYGASVAEQIAMLGTGKDYADKHKISADIWYDQMGGKKEKGIQAADVVGFGFDVATSPLMTSKGGTLLKPLREASSKLLSSMTEKIPLAKAAVDKVGSAFDIWYKVKQNRTAEEVKEIQAAYRDLVESGSAGKFNDLGYNVQQWAKKARDFAGKKWDDANPYNPKNSSAGIDTSQQANYKFTGTRQVIEMTPELQAARAEVQKITMAIDEAKRELTRLKTPKQAPSVMTSRHSTGFWNPETNSFVKDLRSLVFEKKTFTPDPFPIAMQEREIGRLITKLNSKESIVKDLEKASTTTKQGYDDVYKAINEGMTEIQSGFVGKSIDVVNGAVKYVLSFMPRFLTRDIQSGGIQGIVEGSRVQDFYRAVKQIKGKGAVDPDIVGPAMKAGQMSQVGMAEEYTPGIIRGMRNYFESLNRLALINADVRKGKTVAESIDHASDTFFVYGKQYWTEFEKKYASRVLPYYSYFKGTAKYTPEALERNSKIYNTAIMAKEQTTPKEVDQGSTPRWFKDMMTVGAWGNTGWQAEDSFALTLLPLMGDQNRFLSQLSPALTTLTGVMTGWNIKEQRAINQDKKAGQMGFIPGMGMLLGEKYPGSDIDSYRKFFIKELLGVAINPTANALNPSKDITKSFYGTGTYDTSTWNTQKAMGEKQAKEPGFLDTLINRYTPDSFGVGPKGAGAGTALPASSKDSATVRLATDSFLSERWKQFISTKSGTLKVSPDLIGRQYIPDANFPEQTFIHNEIEKWGKDSARDLKSATTNPRKNWELSSAQEKENLLGSAYWSSRVGTPEYTKREKELTDSQNTLKPRTSREPAPFSSALLTSMRRTMGVGDVERAFNKAQEQLITFLSKTGDVLQGTGGLSKSGIMKSEAAQIKAVQAQLSSGNFSVNKEELASRIAAIQQQTTEALQKLEGRGYTATSNILKHWAASESNELTKIEIQRQAALSEFKGGEDYKLYQADRISGAERIAQAEFYINAEYREKERVERTKQLEALLAETKAMSKGAADHAIAALEAAFKRGGMGIDEFFTQRLKEQTKQSVTDIINTLKVLKQELQMPTRPLGYINQGEPDYARMAESQERKNKQKKFIPKEYLAKVDSTQDADTLKFIRDGQKKSQTGRIYGIDALEIKHPENPFSEDQPGAVESAKVFASKLPAGTVIKVVEKGIDDYGRIITQVFKQVEGKWVDVGRQMLAEGWADASLIFAKDSTEYKEQLIALTDARLNKLGIWKLEENSPANYEGPYENRERIKLAQKTGKAIPKAPYSSADKDFEASKVLYESMMKDVNGYIDVLSDKNLDLGKVPEFIKKIIDAMSKFKEKGNFVELTNTFTGLQKELTKMVQDVDNSTKDTIAAKKQLDDAITELNQKVLEMRIQTATKAGNTPLDYDVKNFIFGKNPLISESKYGKSTTPYMKMGEDVRGLTLDEQLKKYDTDTATGIETANRDIKSDDVNMEKWDGESPKDYMARIETELQVHEANKATMTEAGQAKIDQIRTLAVEREKARNLMILEHDKQTTQMRIDVALGMANMIGQAASMLYEASGQKSKEAFYVMKAVAFAEAAIKGYSAIMTAYASGQAAGAPYAGAAVGAAYAAIASAFVGVQLGMIAAQTVAGPAKKAEGGAIEGGSGHTDDVPILAMGGEYVVKKASVKKYGASFMDALNKGLIPVSDMNFNIPTAAYPDYGKTHFEDGGSVAASNINVQKTSKDSGTPVQVINVIDPQLLDKYLASNQGQKTLVNVLAANKYEMQHIMR